MAYFPNSSASEGFENQCSICELGEKACPIYQVQARYNYDACNNEVARSILNELVSDKHGCEMFNRFKEFFLLAE